MLKYFICIVAALGVFSCGKKKEEESKKTELEGIWSDCNKTSSGSAKSTNTFADDTWTGVTITYSDTACSTKSYTIEAGGSFAIGADLTTPTGAKKINYVYTKLNFTIHTDSGINIYNSAKLYTYSDWVKDTTKDILGKNSSVSQSDATNSGDIIYDIFKIDGTKLYLGDRSATATNGKSESARPSSLSTYATTKQ